MPPCTLLVATLLAITSGDRFVVDEVVDRDRVAPRPDAATLGLQGTQGWGGAQAGRIWHARDLSRASESPAEARTAEGAPEPAVDAPRGPGLEEVAPGDHTAAVDQAKAARTAAPSADTWQAEAEACERAGDLACATKGYRESVAALGADAPPARKQALADALARVREKARGRVADEPDSTHRSELDDKRAAKNTPVAVPVDEPPPPKKERIVTKWYFWVAIAAIAASAGAVTGIAIQAGRQQRADDLSTAGAPTLEDRGATLLRF